MTTRIIYPALILSLFFFFIPLEKITAQTRPTPKLNIEIPKLVARVNGVDIESKDRSISTAILDQFCSPKEIKHLMNASHTERLEIWMVKEAVSKATGDGMSIAKEVAIVGDNAYYQSSVFSIIRHEYKGYKIVVAIDYSDSSMDS